MQLVEERLVESIQTAMTEKSRFLYSFVLLYLFEGRHQYKRVRILRLSHVGCGGCSLPDAAVPKRLSGAYSVA